MDKIDLSKIVTTELVAEIVRRRQAIGPSLDSKTCVNDYGLLNDAIDQCRWGNFDLCANYLIRAIPGLWPLGKILRT